MCYLISIRPAKPPGPEAVSAGGHFIVAGLKKHGPEDPDGLDAGDMQKFTVPTSGTAKVIRRQTTCARSVGTDASWFHWKADAARHRRRAG